MVSFLNSSELDCISFFKVLSIKTQEEQIVLRLRNVKNKIKTEYFSLYFQLLQILNNQSMNVLKAIMNQEPEGDKHYLISFLNDHSLF